MLMEENVILVDEQDQVVGEMGKMEAHQKGLLHRAFSIFVFNDKGEMLLQKRASSKYHSGGLWTNTCCSHPRSSETTEQAAKRRLTEEMGFTCELKKTFSFIYRAELDKGLTEYELDHVFIGTFTENPTPNPEEVEDFKWISFNDLKQQVNSYPEEFTVWFKIIFEKVADQINPDQK
jgi:isopentenyl-diphosphate Delta-isomerase